MVGQPLVGQPLTRVQDDFKWSNATHLGTEYAALLVERFIVVARPGQSAGARRRCGSGYRRAGQQDSTFGYHPVLRVRMAGSRCASNRGGKNLYSPSNAWVDNSGAMHLRIAREAED